MRRLGPILIATVGILTARADAQVHDPPLFAAFKAFCIDTRTSPDAVKSAVEAAGGKQRIPPNATASPWPDDGDQLGHHDGRPQHVGLCRNPTGSPDP